ncbi:PAS domain-containing protein [Kineococcus rhizosphaerae]|uniref:histidine kinase n=1 Tax=Kineococcus rhizosphaerae TaxID=559628 RepID=A0A2T0QWT5_9ACTN|nr:PAS domain-containing protein [Kineococcus rhizosphaerae]
MRGAPWCWRGSCVILTLAPVIFPSEGVGTVDDDDRLTREHHVRRRAEQVRSDLAQLWGDEAPPGPDPQMTSLVDALALDDDHGRRSGVLVQGDAIPFPVLVRLLLSSPVGAAVLAELPPAVRARVDLAAATVDPRAMSAWVATRGLPQTPSGAFAMLVDPQVVDLDERVSGLLGYPARQRRLTWEEVLDRVHPDDRAEVDRATREAIAKCSSLSLRFRVADPDGEVRWLSTVGHALTGEDGDTEQVVGFTMPSP